MKKTALTFLSLATLTLISLTQLTTKKVESVSYKLDSSKTTLMWTGKYVSDGHTHTGTINVNNGNLSLNADNSVNGNFTVDMKSIINQDLPEEKKGYLVGHLNGADFFNTEKFSEAKVSVSGMTNKEMMVTINVLGKDVKATLPMQVIKSDQSITAKGKFEIDFASLEMKGTKPSEGKPVDQRTDSKIMFELNLVMNK